jgi:hypothetical protein
MLMLSVGALLMIASLVATRVSMPAAGQSSNLGEFAGMVVAFLCAAGLFTGIMLVLSGALF